MLSEVKQISEHIGSDASWDASSRAYEAICAAEAYDRFEPMDVDTCGRGVAAGRQAATAKRAASRIERRSAMQQQVPQATSSDRSVAVMPLPLAKAARSALKRSIKPGRNGSVEAWCDLIAKCPQHNVNPLILLGSHFEHSSTTLIKSLIDTEDYDALTAVHALIPDTTFAGGKIVRERAYIGEMCSGVRHGRGVWSRDDATCHGSFNLGKLEGIAWKYYPDGTQFRGNFVSDTPQGNGIFAFPDGASVWACFTDALPCGQGRFERADGTNIDVDFFANGTHASFRDDPRNVTYKVSLRADGGLTLHEGVASSHSPSLAEKKRW